MSVLVLGLSHKTAPIEVRERFAISGERRAEFLGALLERPEIDEACILSTCNRVEFLVRSELGAGAEAHVLDVLGRPAPGEVQPAAAPSPGPYLYRYADREAVRHVFRVASSLDSMVVGEPQILGQFKEAYQAAKSAGAVGGTLDRLLSASFRVARRVRNETGIGRMAVSISYVAVELARKIFGDLDGLSVLVIGAGKMSEATARHLRGAGVARIWVTNRTFERAEELARRFDGEAVAYERLFELLTKADIVISSTGAPGFILSKQIAKGVNAARRGRPLFLLDIAVPRDIDPEINSIDEMFVYDIDDLQQVADANLEQRRREADRAEEIVEEEVEKMLLALRGARMGPTIAALQQRLEEVRAAELERFRAKLGDLTPEQERALEHLTRGMMNKIAHHPIAEMKRLAGHPDQSRFVELVRRAFNLRRS